MDMLGKVRRMKMREKLTISEIAKRTGLARNTVKRWLNAPGDISQQSRRMPPHFFPCAQTVELSCFQRGDRACGLSWRSSVV